MAMTKDSNISTHVLDTALGVPASALHLELFLCVDPLPVDCRADLHWQSLGSTSTDHDGRARFVFDINPGIYKMVFYTMDYFERMATPNFYPKVEIIFRISDVVRHHHVPLLLSPYGYSTYRGS
jgi:5-hydroxyisourate hydrolase